MKLSAFASFVLLFTSLAVLGCSQAKSKSQEVDVEVIPNKPIVFTANASVPTEGGGSRTINAPWVKFNVKIKNASDSPILVIGLKAKASIGTTNGGGQSTGDASFDPSGFNYTDTSVDPAISCSYNDFGDFAAGSDAAYLNLFPTEGTDGGCSKFTVDFYFSGMPAGSSYRYKLEVTPLGYFINSDNEPSDRFERSEIVRTQ